MEVWRSWAATPFGKEQLPIFPVAVQFTLKLCPFDCVQDGLFQVPKIANINMKTLEIN